MRFRLLCLVGALVVSNFVWTGSEVQAKTHKAPQSGSIYKVRSGDNLSSISHKLGVSVAQLKKLNHLKTDRLDIGQVLLTSTKSKNAKSRKVSRGSKTERVLKTAKNGVREKRTAKVSRGLPGERIAGELVPWEEANRLFAEGMVVKIYDLDSGLTFRAKRNFGHNHADADPLTTADTATMRELFGGSWSWNRRAIVVDIDGRLVAASMNGMPHGNKVVRDNDFPGHFCIHFLGSKTHGSSYTKTGVPIVDDEHQAMVRKAAGY